jgi:hypothetical protein
MCDTPTHTPESFVDCIPDQEVIRERLVRCNREADLLRRLLRLAERRDLEVARLAEGVHHA